MKLFYNKLISKFEEFYYEDHLQELLDHILEIRRRNDGVIALKLRCNDRLQELKNFKPAVDTERLQHACKEIASNNEPIKIEMVLKLPDPDKYYSGDKIEVAPLANEPVFFRIDGSPVNMVNQFYGAGIFLICNGPSFNEMNHDLLKQPGIITFGINNGAHVFRPDFWTSVDAPHRFMDSIWRDPKITKFVPMSNMEKKFYVTDAYDNGHWSHRGPDSCRNIIGYKRNETFEPEMFMTQPTINWGNHKERGGGRSVMVAAIKLIYCLGFRRVYLLGCDFNMSKDQKYFFEEDRNPQAIKNNNNSYEIMRGYFERLLPYFEATDFEVYNCYEYSGLKTFPFKSFKDAIDKELVDTSANTRGMYIKRNQDEDADR